MTTPSGIRFVAGLRYAQVFELDANGYPKASASTPYAGVTLKGLKTWEYSDPEPRKITHTGDDRALALDYLPAQEAASGTITTSPVNDSIDALLSGLAEFTTGSAKMLLFSTDKRGSEPDVAILVYAQAVDESDGRRVWDSKIFPKSRLYALEAGYGEAEVTKSYTFSPQFVKKHLWGVQFSTNVEGALTAQGVRVNTDDKPRIVAWKASGSESVYNFETDYPAIDAATVTVWKNGVLQTTPGDYSATTTQVAFGASPAANAMIVALYEHA